MTTYYVDGAVGSDTNAGTSPGAGNAWATIGKLLATWAASDVGYVKSSATYTLTTGLTFAASLNDLPNVPPNYLLGYTTTPGDNGMATITTSAAIVLLTLAGNNIFVGNLIFDGNQIATKAISITASSPERGMRLSNIIVRNGVTTNGIVSTAGAPFIASRILVMGMKAAATSAFDGPVNLHASAFVNNQCHALALNTYGSTSYRNCVIANNNSGGTYHGIYLPSALSSVAISNCVSYNNSGDGVNVTGSYEAFDVAQSILVKNGGYGLDSTLSTTVGSLLMDRNAFYSNTSGSYHGVLAGPGDITLTGDPFIAPAGTVSTLADVWVNFTINGTAGAGGSCRAAGYPGYLDIGAVQHQDSGGTTTYIINKTMTNYIVDEGEY